MLISSVFKLGKFQKWKKVHESVLLLRIKGNGFEDETVFVGFVVGFSLFTWFFSHLAWRSPAHKTFMERIIIVFVEISFPVSFSDGKLTVSFLS